MKKQTHIPTHSLIHPFVETAPMQAVCARLCAAILVLTQSGRLREMMEQTREFRRVLRAMSRAAFHNHQREMKLSMLSHGGWRARVLNELGGLMKLERWDAAMSRYEASCLRRNERGNDAALKDRKDVWRKTPERQAEETRLKAHARKCAKATAHPRITRDPFRVDFEGQFRLAPLPRLSRPRRDPATVPFNIMDYNYNGIAVAKMSGFDAPITVWPVEFRAAAKIEAEMLQCDSASSVIPHDPRRADDAGPITEDDTLLSAPGSAAFGSARDAKIDERIKEHPD